MATRSDVQARLAGLAHRPPAARPVVSVYLNTRWTDEAQRERVRIFLKNHLREARAAAERPADEDLAGSRARASGSSASTSSPTPAAWR